MDIDTYLDFILKKYKLIQSVTIYFGKSNGSSLFNGKLTKEQIERVVSHFISCSRKIENYKKITHNMNVLKIFADKTECYRIMAKYTKTIVLPEIDIIIIGNKKEKINEIEFPSIKQYHQTINCSDIIFTIDPKIILIINTENNIQIDCIIDDYADTTLQNVKNIIYNIKDLLAITKNNTLATSFT